jgi:hypothetical protein
MVYEKFRKSNPILIDLRGRIEWKVSHSAIFCSCRITLGMELVLNVAWGLLAGVMFCLWRRFRSREGVDRRGQFVALVVLLLILFPVISLTDDLQAALNPAEADFCLRRDQGNSLPHSILPPVAALPVSRLAELSFSAQRMVAPGGLEAPIFDLPALAPIQNQPPPPAA